MKHRLGEEPATPVVESAGGPVRQRRLILTPLDAGPSGILAMMSTVDSPRHFVNMLIAQGERCSMFQVAQLLALFAIDEREQILQASFMPSRGSHAVMFADGTLRHSRGRTFAAWILDEAGRLAAVLLALHAPYVRGVRDVLSQKAVRGFDFLPEDFIFEDPLRSCRLAPLQPKLEIDLSRSPATQGMAWHRIVKVEYVRDRYMRQLSRDQIGQRLMDITGNMHDIDDNGLVTLNSGDGANWYWKVKMMEVAAEMGHRYGPYPAGWEGLLTGVERTKSLEAEKWKFSGPLPAPSRLTRPYLVKYEDRRFLESMLTKGAIRLSPASKFADSSLNAAIRDDELSAELDVTPLQMAGFAGLPGPIAARAERRRQITKRLGTNYYVYCMSTRFLTRLAHDFERDAAMVIHEPAEFYARLERAIREQLPRWRMITTSVQYYDPLNVSELEVDVLTWKHFRFAYQHETRAAWLPPAPLQELAPIDVTVGPLDDICEIMLPTMKA